MKDHRDVKSGLAAAALALAALASPVGAAGPPKTEPAVFPVPLSDDLLIVFAQPKAGQEKALATWYDRHLREFAAIPGVKAAQRFTLTKQSKVSDGLLDQLAMYEVSAQTAPDLDGEVQRRLKDGRIRPGDAFYEPSIFHLLYRPLSPATAAKAILGTDPKPIGSGALTDNYLVVLSDPTTPEQEDAYNTWYDHQHVPDVLRVPGFVSAQRFVRIGGGARMPRYAVIFKFKSRDVDATNKEIGRRIREKITVMSPAFGGDSAKGAIATPAGPVVLAAVH